jgi:hypothetical protein
VVRKERAVTGRASALPVIRVELKPVPVRVEGEKLLLGIFL